MAKFVVRQTATGYQFRLKAGNGETIAASEVYNTRAACMKGVESVKSSCVGEIEDHTVQSITAVKNPKFEVYVDKTEEFRFRLKAKNGKVVATSQGYTTKAACENGVASVKKNAPLADIEEA